MGVFLDVMLAVNRSIEVGSNQQLADTTTTRGDIALEQSVYKDWLNRIDLATASVTKWADALASGKYNGKTKTYCQNALTKAQTILQNTQTKEQTFTQQADSGTQAMQNQTGQDSSTMQQKVSLMSSLMQAMQTLTSALAR
jgi:hypothetical protein